jgi:hypothetical protein
MSQDPFAELKSRQREMWASFTPTATFTTPVAGHLVRFASISAGETVLDVGTGTGSSRSPRRAPAPASRRST